jgi:Tfp pilus assembly protein FimT
MPCRAPHPASGFTLLEICIALAIAMMIVTIAVPSLKGVLKQNGTQDSFTQFDKLAQEAHSRSISERRAYILIWSPKPDSTEEMQITVRPDTLANKEEAEGVAQVTLKREEAPHISFPATLTKETLEIWVFWPNGSCEPAIVKYSGKSGKWTANYNAFTAQAGVSYE